VIALDTNVLVRYLVRDDARQTRLATQAIESSCTHEDPGFVSQFVLCELVWVLVQGYGYARDEVALVLRKLLAARDLAVESREVAWQALNLYEEGPADVSDYVIGLSGRAARAEATWTFDRRAARSPLFRLVSG
jgi:predicted nucleic-acid-binding protein